MKAKHLWILAAALVVLAGLRFAMDRGPRTAGSLEDAGLGRVLGENFDAGAVTWLRVRGPGEEGETLVARKADSGWVVESAHDAPAEQEQVEEFVQGLGRLRGETRGEGQALFAEFGLDEASAARLELGSGPGAVVATLRLGKPGDSPSSHFVAVEGEDRIRHVAQGLTSGLGFFGDARDPDPQHWVRKQVLDVDSPAVTAVAAERPDASWRLVKRAPETPAEGEEEAAAESEWVVEEPGWDWSLRTGGPDGVVSRASRLRATSVLEPAACASGLDSTLRLTTAEGEHVVHLGSALLEGDVVPMRLDDGAACYGLSRWTAQSLLPKASQLFDVPKPLGAEPPPADEFSRLEIERDGQTIRLERDGDEWSLTKPERAPADEARVNRLISALRFLSWDDVVAAERAPGEVSATVTARSGDRTFTLRLRGERAGVAGGARYAEIEGGDALPAGLLGVLPDSTVDSLLPPLDDLRAPADADG